IVLAVAIAVVRVAPAFDDAPMIHVGHRLDGVVDPLVDALEVLPGLLRKHDIAGLEWPTIALARQLGAEIGPADRRARDIANGDEQRALIRLRGRQAHRSHYSRAADAGAQ